MKKNIFKKRKTIFQVEESNELAPKFDKDGLIPTITTDYKTGEVRDSYIKQVENYKDLLSEIYSREIKGLLIYVDSNKTIEQSKLAIYSNLLFLPFFLGKKPSK